MAGQPQGGEAGRAEPGVVLTFWFSERVRPLWFAATPDLDREIAERFLATWEQARAGALEPWEQSAAGALALVVVLDQLPLNMFRGRPESFATEAAARAVAERAIERGFDRRVAAEQRGFFYLPFMHSESLADQDRSVALYAGAGLEEGVRWACHHRAIVRRFGRFPHRNAILGRESTAGERAYLASGEAFRG
jgi:uncharacterized protein (DUF924 family)